MTEVRAFTCEETTMTDKPSEQAPTAPHQWGDSMSVCIARLATEADRLTKMLAGLQADNDRRREKMQHITELLARRDKVLRAARQAVRAWEDSDEPRPHEFVALMHSIDDLDADETPAPDWDAIKEEHGVDDAFVAKAKEIFAKHWDVLGRLAKGENQ